MTDFVIRVPHRARDESLVDVASNCRHLEGDESAVSRTIVLEGLTGGMRTAGELLDHLGALEPGDRRALLDRARAACDLPSTATVEALERSAVATRAATARAAAESPYQLCHGRIGDRQCNAMPIDNLGTPIPVNACRWFCPEHVDQAAPGDMDPRPLPWKYSESGAIVPNDDPAEHAREAAALESRQRQQEAVLADRAAEAAASREHQDAVAEQHNRELPPHLRRPVA